MTRSIWVKRLLPSVQIQAKRVKQEKDEYNLITKAEFPFTVEASSAPEPVKGWELNVLPEGYRIKSVYKIFCKTPLQSSEEGKNDYPDEILINGAWYVVFKVEPWVNGLDTNYCAYLVNKNQR